MRSAQNTQRKEQPVPIKWNRALTLNRYAIPKTSVLLWATFRLKVCSPRTGSVIEDNWI